MTVLLDGLPVFQASTYLAHVDAFRAVQASAQRHVWTLAAIAASLERQCGARTDVSGQRTDLQRFCIDVGISRQHYHYLADTYRAFSGPGNTGVTRLIDSPELTFKHFAVAAKLADDPAAAVIEAYENGWGANELERQLRQRRETREFSLAEALARLWTTIGDQIAAWPQDARAKLPEVFHGFAEDLQARILPPLSPSVVHAIRWIKAEMENLPFSNRNYCEAGAGRGGDLEVSGGAAGASIYQAIIGTVSNVSRARVLSAVDALLAGKVTPTGQLVLGVARDLASAKPSVVRQMCLPPEAGGDATGTLFERLRIDDEEDDLPDCLRELVTADVSDPIGLRDEEVVW